MSLRTIYILLSFLVFFTSAGAQLPMTNKAAQLCQEKNFEGAVQAIDEAMDNEDEKNDPYAWYVRGFIFKEIYKTRETNLRDSENRRIAVASFEKSISLDQAGEHISMSRAALKYLATSYLNDALRRTAEITRETEGEPQAIFNEFSRIMKIVDPAEDVSAYQRELNRKLAQAHYHLWELNIREPYHAQRALAFYEEIVQTSPNDCEAHYNLAILIYNQAVYKIRTIDSNTDIMQLIMIQDECVALFKDALPHAQLVFDNCPKRLEHYKALMFINRALGNEEEFDRLKAESESLIRQGELKK